MFNSSTRIEVVEARKVKESFQTYGKYCFPIVRTWTWAGCTVGVRKEGDVIHIIRII